MTTQQGGVGGSATPSEAELPWAAFEPRLDQHVPRDAPERESACWRAMLDCCPQGMVRLDASRRVTHVNAAWRNLARGLRPDAQGDGIGRDYIELASELSDSLALAVAGILEALPRHPEAGARAEYRCTIDGAPRWFRLVGKSAADGVVLVFSDISDQCRVEAALIVHSVVSAALTERPIFVTAVARLAATARELFGWAFSAVWIPDHWEKLVCSEVDVDARLDGSEFEALTRAQSFERGLGLPGRVWQSGSPVWLSVLGEEEGDPRIARARAIGLRSSVAIPLQRNGQVLAVLEFFGTERRSEDREQVELLGTAGSELGAEELRARTNMPSDDDEPLTRTRFEAVFENTPGYILAVNPRRRIIYINRVLAHLRKDEIVGSDWMRFVPPVEHDAMNAKLDEVFARGTPQHHEMSMLGPDGKQIWFSLHMAAVREGDQVVAAAISSQDSTELKRTQLEFAAAQRWVAVGTLAAGVAHEINTPIQFVSDNLYFIGDASRRLLGLMSKLQPLLPLVESGAPAHELRSAAEAAAKACKGARLSFLEAELPKAVEACADGLGRVSTIVHSLKEFAHPPSSEKEPADLNRIIERSLTIAVNEYKYVADLRTQFGELPPVPCLVGEIGQVELNLVVNAAHAIGDVVKGSERKGTLEVRTWCEKGEAVIAISDTGTGIDPAIRARIFDPFFTTKEVGKGTGQGLALARSVIKHKHGGSIAFESTLGKGTTFFVRLPLE